MRRQARQGPARRRPAPVHVTGHSMVQPYFGFPQKLSSLLDRPVSLNWKPGNVGQWTMLLEYLESPAFKAHKPQVLVWQMFEPTYSYGPNAAGQWDNASLMPSATWLSGCAPHSRADPWTKPRKTCKPTRATGAMPGSGAPCCCRPGLGWLVAGPPRPQGRRAAAVGLARWPRGHAEQGPAPACAVLAGNRPGRAALSPAGRYGRAGGPGLPAVDVLPRRPAAPAG